MEWSSDVEELNAHVGRLPEGYIPLFVVSTIVFVDNEGQRSYNVRVVAPEDAYPQITDVVATCAIAEHVSALDLRLKGEDDQL